LELTLSIALELAQPQIQYELRYEMSAVSHDLHAFRLVCKIFSTIGKKAWVILAKEYPTSGYTTLRLPPRENSLLDLAEVFLADEGLLGKLVTRFQLVVMPSTHTEVVNAGVSRDRWDSERPPTPPYYSATHQAQKRVIAVEQLESCFEMSSNQMAFLRNAITPASQAMLGLILAKIPNAVSLDIFTPDDRHWLEPSKFSWVDEYDYAGCCKLMSSLSSRYEFASMTLDFGDLELTTPLPFPLLVTKITSMQLLPSQAFFERDIIVGALTSAKELTALNLCLEEVTEDDVEQLGILASVPVIPKLKSFCLTRFKFSEAWRGWNQSTIAQFLYAHRGTLEVVKLEGYVLEESMLLNIVYFIRSKLRLRDCDLELWTSIDYISFELRDLIRRLGGHAVINDSEDIEGRHLALLNRYVLRR